MPSRYVHGEVLSGVGGKNPDRREDLFAGDERLARRTSARH